MTLIIIADANFPSDAIAAKCIITSPIRVFGSTTDILTDILKLFPTDSYNNYLSVMDRVESDKDTKLVVAAYDLFADIASQHQMNGLHFVERQQFYELAKTCFCIIQVFVNYIISNLLIRILS
jgi:L-fucose mutarotase